MHGHRGTEIQNSLRGTARQTKGKTLHFLFAEIKKTALFLLAPRTSLPAIRAAEYCLAINQWYPFLWPQAESKDAEVIPRLT
jgi:hypothetical protein